MSEAFLKNFLHLADSNFFSATAMAGELLISSER